MGLLTLPLLPYQIQVGEYALDMILPDDLAEAASGAAKGIALGGMGVLIIAGIVAYMVLK